jgi:hypothetical protein
MVVREGTRVVVVVLALRPMLMGMFVAMGMIISMRVVGLDAHGVLSGQSAAAVFTH